MDATRVDRALPWTSLRGLEPQWLMSRKLEFSQDSDITTDGTYMVTPIISSLLALLLPRFNVPLEQSHTEMNCPYSQI